MTLDSYTETNTPGRFARLCSADTNPTLATNSTSSTTETTCHSTATLDSVGPDITTSGKR
jgi:hypothetical protein